MSKSNQIPKHKWHLWWVGILVILIFIPFVGFALWSLTRADAATKYSDFVEADAVPTISFDSSLKCDSNDKKLLYQLTRDLVIARSTGKVVGKIDPEYVVSFGGFSTTQNTYEMHVYMFGLIHFAEVAPDGTKVRSSTWRRSRTSRVSPIIEWFFQTKAKQK